MKSVLIPCQKKTYEEDKIKSLAVGEVISQLEGVIGTLCGVVGDHTNNLNRNDNMQLDYLDPRPSTQPS